MGFWVYDVFRLILSKTTQYSFILLTFHTYGIYSKIQFIDEQIITY